MGFWIPLLVSLVINVIAYAILPKPKNQTTRPEAAREMDSPTAEAGRPIPVVFGKKKLKAPNFLYYTDKNIEEFDI